MKKNIESVIKKCFFIIFCIVCNAPFYAQERSLEEVADSALTFLLRMNVIPVSSNHTSQLKMKTDMDIQPITRYNTTYLYSVNLPTGGWALISNEKRYKAILGYSRNGKLNTDIAEMPPALNDLLCHHMNMIDSLRINGYDVFNSRQIYHNTYTNRSSNYIIGETLLYKDGEYITWNQSRNNWGCSTTDETDPCCNRVYNRFCPTNENKGCGHSLAGCGAVAMGQLMCYWGWPNQAEISDTITNEFFCLCGIPSTSKSTHYYDWKYMPARMTNLTDLYQVDNIAKLLRDCGYAAQTLYYAIGSIAMMEKIDIAMRETFHYHATFVIDNSNLDVASMIKNDIDARRPVMSQSWNSNHEDHTPHTFLIDGYTNDDMFHINFGWGGKDDGWYDVGFYGYTPLRNFLTEIYPACDQLAYTIVNPDTTINVGENMVLYAEHICLGAESHNITIADGGYLLAEASNSIVLQAGFHAEYGSCVHLKIRDFCDTIGSYVRQTPNRIVGNNNSDEDSLSSRGNYAPFINDTYLNITPNPVGAILHVQTTEYLAQVKIYNINGQCVLQSTQTDIDVSALPQGLYILRAITTSGTLRQEKFIKE